MNDKRGVPAIFEGVIKAKVLAADAIAVVVLQQ